MIKLIRTALSAESGVNQDSMRTFGLPVNVQRVKIDAGMSMDAGHARRWLMDDPDLLVIGFEPLEECRKSIEGLFLESGLGVSDRKRLWLLPFALGSRNTWTTFFLCEDTGQSSVYFPEKFAVRETIKIPQVRLDSVLDQISFLDPVGRIDYVKTDCQGADFQIALGAGKYLKQIAVWTSEVDTFGYTHSKNRSRDFLRLFQEEGFSWLNRRSRFRVWLGGLILRSSFHPLFLKATSGLKNIGSAAQAGSTLAPKIEVQDATFVNGRFRDEIARGAITAFQSG